MTHHQCLPATAALIVACLLTPTAHGQHFYTTEDNGEQATQAGYTNEGIAGYVYQGPNAATVPIHRWYKSSIGAHFYTADPNGEKAPIQAYVPEGVRFHCLAEPQEGSVPLFRWYKSALGHHFYTTDSKGELAPQNGYVLDEVPITCHVFPPQKPKPGTVPLYRWYRGPARDLCVVMVQGNGNVVGKRPISVISDAEIEPKAKAEYEDHNRTSLTNFRASKYSVRNGKC